MKTLLALALVASTATVAAAQSADQTPCYAPCQVLPSPPPQQPQPQPRPVPPQPAQVQPAVPVPTVIYAVPAVQPQQIVQAVAQPAATLSANADDDEGDSWHTPVGHRFMHGFRLGWTYVEHWDQPEASRMGKSIKDQFGLKSPNMMLLGYEGFYRIVGHSWLNVLMVGNVTVAGLEQSKFIPAASGLIGFEFDKSFQLGVGVNLTPDPQAPSHMIAAAGWTPHAGSIMVPLHFFYIPDADGNNRMGATVGMNW
jgi:hypothetical protein